MKKKYNTLYIYKNNNVYDSNGNIVHSSEYNMIIKKYKPPSHLHNIRIIAKNLHDADNGLIYIGLDKNNKKQYIYGYNYVLNRNFKRISTFLLVDSIKDEIQHFINTNLLSIKKYEDITIKKLFALVLLIEMSFYIRTGKKIYFDTNDTIGLLTIMRKHLQFENNGLIISFKGKVNQWQKFTIKRAHHKLLYDILHILYKKLSNKDFILTCNEGVFTEYMLYNMLNSYFNIKLKDLRTYGVNKIFLNELWNYFQLESDGVTIKKALKVIIENTATIIGHSSTISKKSYIVVELLKLINDDIIKKIKSMDLENFYNYMLKMLKNTIKINE